MHFTLFGKIGITLLWLVFAFAPSLSRAADKPANSTLVIGLVPNLSARALISAFQPMKESLEKQLKQPVELYTAPNFRAFHESTLKGEYDLIVTPAHFAWLAMREAKYVPLLTYENPLRGLMIVKRGSSITSAQALRGKKVGITDPLALVAMRGQQWLKEQGLQPGTDFSVHRSAPHNTAALAVGSGELDAAIIGSGPYLIMPEETRSQVQVLSEVGAVPNASYLVSDKLPKAHRNALKKALLHFANNTAEGKQFMEQYQYGGFKPIRADDLKPMEVYSQRMKELLAETGS